MGTIFGCHGNLNGSMFGDVRGGFWVFSREDCVMIRYSEINGTLLQTIDLTNNFTQCQITSQVTMVGFGEDLTLVMATSQQSDTWLLGNTYP